MEIVDNIEKYITKKMEQDISQDELIKNINHSVSLLARKLFNAQHILYDVNSGNFGFRGDEVVLLDFDTLTPNNYITLERIIVWLSGGLINTIKEKYKQ